VVISLNVQVLQTCSQQ